MAIIALLITSRPFGSRKAYRRAVLFLEVYTALVLTAGVLFLWVRP